MQIILAFVIGFLISDIKTLLTSFFSQLIVYWRVEHYEKK